MTTKELNELADRVHQLAKDKGWHSFEETDSEFETRSTNNLHGEISELWEAHRSGVLAKLCDKWEKMQTLDIKPLTCAEEELADIVIRTLDSCRRANVDVMLPDDPFGIVTSVPISVSNMHSRVDIMKTMFMHPRIHASLIGDCLMCAKLLRFDLWSAVERKHQYNATREYRHGGKVA